MKNIVETAVEDGRFTMLVEALKAAGLTDDLKGTGPFTVFAPTDDAFKSLPAGTVENLLKDVPNLKAVLTYHVVPGKVSAADVAKMNEARLLAKGMNPLAARPAATLIILDSAMPTL